MKNLHILTLILVFSLGLANTMKSQSADEFRNRRKEIIKKMEPASVLILRTPQMSARFDYSRPGGNFYYLTGIDEPDCTLILFSDYFQPLSSLNASAKEVLFIKPINSDRMNWDAQTIGIDGARSDYGIEDVRPD